MAPSRHGRRRIALALLVGMAGCEMPSLPMAPSDLTSGVSIYEHANFLGNSALLTESNTDLSEYDGPCEHADGETTIHDWNDCVSSIRVAQDGGRLLTATPIIVGSQLSCQPIRQTCNWSRVAARTTG